MAVASSSPSSNALRSICLAALATCAVRWASVIGFVMVSGGMRLFPSACATVSPALWLRSRPVRPPDTSDRVCCQSRWKAPFTRVQAVSWSSFHQVGDRLGVLFSSNMGSPWVSHFLWREHGAWVRRAFAVDPIRTHAGFPNNADGATMALPPWGTLAFVVGAPREAPRNQARGKPLPAPCCGRRGAAGDVCGRARTLPAWNQATALAAARRTSTIVSACTAAGVTPGSRAAAPSVAGCAAARRSRASMESAAMVA